MVAGEAIKDFEPLYGEFYLPRKVGYMHYEYPLDSGAFSSRSLSQYPQQMMSMSLQTISALLRL